MEISIFIIALAFAILVVYVIKTLKSVQKSTEQINEGLIHMQKEIDLVSKEITELIRNTNKLTIDLQEKSKSLDSLFHSIDDVGSVVNQVTQSAKQVSSTLTGTLQRSVENATVQRDKVDEVMKYISLGLSIWQKFQSRKEKQVNKNK